MLDLLKRVDTLCTCCPTPRRMRFNPAGGNYHTDDATEATVSHVHLSGYGRDCDGGHSWEHVYMPNADDETIMDVWRGVVRRMVDPWAEYGQTVKIHDGHAESSQQTDEGHRSESAHVCHDDGCAYDAMTYRAEFWVDELLADNDWL